MKLAEALIERAEVKKRLASIATRMNENSITEIVRTIDTAELQKTIDKLSREYRELDTSIQRFNWNVELL